MRKPIVAIAFALIAASCGGSDPGATRLEDSMFEHSGGAPLDVAEGVEISFAPFPDADMRSIEYNNPDGDRVTGIIAYPSDGLSEVGVLVLPGLPETATDNLEPLALLSCAGATAIATNPPYVREGRMAEPLMFDETDREEQILFTIEAKRAIDVLEAMGATRFGVTAVSWGVSIGAVLAGVEDRIEAYGFMIGHGGLIDRFLPDGEPVGPLVDVPADRREEWIQAMAPLDAVLYVGDSTADILFQNGRTDPDVTPESAERLHAAAPASREVLWYDLGHEVSAEMVSDHFKWLGDHLGLDAARVDECVALSPTGGS